MLSQILCLFISYSDLGSLFLVCLLLEAGDISLSLGCQDSLSVPLDNGSVFQSVFLSVF